MQPNDQQRTTSNELTGNETDPFANLPEHEAISLQKAEFRYLSRPGEHNRFSDFPHIDEQQIIGTYFSCYDNTSSMDDTSLPEELRRVPLLVHSEKNRFAYLCSTAMRYWIPELDLFVAAMLRLEDELRNGREPDEELAWEAESFGLQVNSDNFVIGYTGTSSPLVANKELIVRLLEFFGRGLCAVEQKTDLKFRPASILDQLQAVRNLKTKRE